MEKIIKNLDSNKAHRSDMLQICIKSKIKPLLIIYKHLYKHYKLFIQNNLITPISPILRQVNQA